MKNVGLNGCKSWEELIQKFGGTIHVSPGIGKTKSASQSPGRKNDNYKSNPAFQMHQASKGESRAKVEPKEINKEFTRRYFTPIDLARTEGGTGIVISLENKGKWEWYRVKDHPPIDYYRLPPKKRIKDPRLWYDDVDARVYSTVGYVHCGIEVPFSLRNDLDNLELARYAAKDWELAQYGVPGEIPKSQVEIIADELPEFETLNLEI